MLDLHYTILIFLAIFIPALALGMIAQKRKEQNLIPQISKGKKICNYHMNDIVEYCLGKVKFSYRITNNGNCNFTDKDKLCNIKAGYELV